MPFALHCFFCSCHAWIKTFTQRRAEWITESLTSIHRVADGLSGFQHQCAERRWGCRPIRGCFSARSSLLIACHSVSTVKEFCSLGNSFLLIQRIRYHLESLNCGWQLQCFHLLAAAAPSFSGGS